MIGEVRKIKGKTIIFMMVMVLLALHIFGCGKAQETSTTAQKEFVYVPEFISLEDEKNGYMDQITVIGDNIYYISSEYDETAQTNTSYLCTLKVGETKPVKTPLELENDTSISRMFASPDGNLQMILFTWLYDETETEPSGDEEEDENADEADNDTEKTASASSGTVIIGGGGGMAVSATADTVAGDSNNEGMDDYQEPVSQKIELCMMGMDGKVISTVDISDVFTDKDNAYVQRAEMDRDGNIYINTDQMIIVLNKEGKKLFDLKADNWIDNLFSTKDGTVLASYYGAGELEVHPIDLQKKAFGEAYTNMMVSSYGNYTFAKGSDTDLLFSAENTLYSYNIGDEAPVEILNWIDCDINTNELQSFAVLSDGRILAITRSYEAESSKTEMIYLTKKKGSEVPEKKILSYATMSLNYDMKKRVIDFNKTNQEYRVEVKEYGTDDWVSGLAQMNTDIVSGKAPDIMDLSYGNIRKYALKGLLEDLYPYMDKDPEINREDYLENILKAYETDGKLYGITPQFIISTVVAKVSDVGERKSITLEELMDLAKKLPEGTKLYEYATKESVLMNNTTMNMERFVDWSTGECKFNSDEFINMLEFSNTFDKEMNYSQEGPDTATMLHDGTLLMLQYSISSMQEYQMLEGMFGEPIAFVGYPTDGDNGSFIADTGNALGINSKSGNKEGAWQFIRTGIAKEAQEDADRDSWGFPIMKSALEAQFQKDMTDEYYELPDGTKEKQAKTSWGYGSFNMDIYAATEEQVAVVRNLIDSVSQMYQYDEEINNIITEESAAFFEGQKTAKDVADMIQSRVQIYVNENR